MRRLVLLTLMVLAASGAACYASMEPPVQMQYPEGGPTLWVVVVMPLNWEDHAREKRPSTLIGRKNDKPGVLQGVLIVANFESGKKNFLDLKTLSRADVVQLWGELKTTDDPEINTVELIRPMEKYPNYHVDVKFNDDRLSSYRIRHQDFQDPTWTELSN